VLEASPESFGKTQARVLSSVAGVIRAWRRLTGDGDDGLGALDVVNCFEMPFCRSGALYVICAAVEAWGMCWVC
jgi:hypothetical protein